jgi:hypothetical protein
MPETDQFISQEQDALIWVGFQTFRVIIHPHPPGIPMSGQRLSPMARGSKGEKGLNHYDKPSDRKINPKS